VADKILFPEETRTLRFIRADTNTTVHEITRPESQPQIQFDWDPPEEMVVDGRQVISWTAGHPEELPLQFLVFYSHTDGQTWQPANLPLEDRELELDFDQLPGGERCRVKVLATDGANTTEVESGTFRVAEKGLRATILAPEDGATFPLGQAIWLRGQGFHLEEQRPELEDLTWTSSIDGELGSGSVVEVGPSQGRHDITLRAGEHRARISLKVVATLDMPT
jgi:hypothetical protein